MVELDASWDRSEYWNRKGKTFTVEINRFVSKKHPESLRGPNNWTVHAYVRKGHPHFKEIVDGNSHQEATEDMPFRGGCTYIHWYYGKDGEPLCVEVGADYGHLHDEHYSYLEDLPVGVDHDANALYEWMEARESEARDGGR